eukprot:364585-Chlamydomonas_euryale.AAC.9
MSTGKTPDRTPNAGCGETGHLAESAFLRGPVPGLTRSRAEDSIQAAGSRAPGRRVHHRRCMPMDRPAHDWNRLATTLAPCMPTYAPILVPAMCKLPHQPVPMHAPALMLSRPAGCPELSPKPNCCPNQAVAQSNHDLDLCTTPYTRHCQEHVNTAHTLDAHTCHAAMPAQMCKLHIGNGYVVVRGLHTNVMLAILPPCTTYVAMQSSTPSLGSPVMTCTAMSHSALGLQLIPMA